MEDSRVLKRRFKLLQDGFKKDRRIRVLTESLKETMLQAALAKGNRRIGELLLWACDRQTGLKEAFQHYGLAPETEACRSIGLAAPLPWDHLDMGVTREYLLRERHNSETGTFTPGCFDGCQRCGVCKKEE